MYKVFTPLKPRDEGEVYSLGLFIALLLVLENVVWKHVVSLLMMSDCAPVETFGRFNWMPTTQININQMLLSKGCFGEFG